MKRVGDEELDHPIHQCACVRASNPFDDPSSNYIFLYGGELWWPTLRWNGRKRLALERVVVSIDREFVQKEHLHIDRMVTPHLFLFALLWYQRAGDTGAFCLTRMVV